MRFARQGTPDAVHATLLSYNQRVFHMLLLTVFHAMKA